MSVTVGAALFSDGTAAGDATWLRLLKQRRSDLLAQYLAVQSRLQTYTINKVSVADAIADLEAAQQQYLQSLPGKAPFAQAFHEAISDFKANTTGFKTGALYDDRHMPSALAIATEATQEMIKSLQADFGPASARNQ